MNSLSQHRPPFKAYQAPSLGEGWGGCRRLLVPSDLQSDGFQVRICNPQTTLPEHLHKCFERITNPYSIFRRIANPPKHSLPLPPFTQKNPVRRSGARDFRINYLLSLSLISSAPSRLFRQLCARCRCPLRPSCLPGGRLLCR